MNLPVLAPPPTADDRAILVPPIAEGCFVHMYVQSIVLLHGETRHLPVRSLRKAKAERDLMQGLWQTIPNHDLSLVSILYLDAFMSRMGDPVPAEAASCC